MALRSSFDSGRAPVSGRARRSFQALTRSMRDAQSSEMRGSSELNTIGE